MAGTRGKTPAAAPPGTSGTTDQAKLGLQLDAELHDTQTGNDTIQVAGTGASTVNTFTIDDAGPTAAQKAALEKLEFQARLDALQCLRNKTEVENAQVRAAAALTDRFTTVAIAGENSGANGQESGSDIYGHFRRRLRHPSGHQQPHPTFLAGTMEGHGNLGGRLLCYKPSKEVCPAGDD